MKSQLYEATFLLLFMRSVPLVVVERCNKRSISVSQLANKSARLKSRQILRRTESSKKTEAPHFLRGYFGLQGEEQKKEDILECL